MEKQKLINMDITQIKTLEHFTMFLNEQPKKTITNKLARGAKYVPIGEIEKTLDELFAGLWQVKNFQYQVVANEIVGSISLEVFHPIAMKWIERIGAGAVQIMVSSGKQAILENKIKNALESGFPKLKSECIKNAAKTLGAVFGRNLNRPQLTAQTKLSDKITPQKLVLTQNTETWDNVVSALKDGFTIADVLNKYDATPENIELLTSKNKQNESTEI